MSNCTTATNGKTTKTFKNPPLTRIRFNIFKYLSAFALVMLLGVNGVMGQSPQTFTASGTWTCPAGVTSVQVQCWGGGGAGGSAVGTATNSRRAAAGGGAGGAYVISTINVIPGTVYTLTVGTGGVAVNTNGVATSGGDSWFSTNTTIIAKGGAGANSLVCTTSSDLTSSGGAGTTTGSIGTTVYKGGDGASGTTPSGSGFSGGGGSSAGTSSNGISATNNLAAAAVTGGGIGGAGRSSSGGNGSVPASGIGGGGGGAWAAGSLTQRTGGSGANGQIILTWSVTATPSIAISNGSIAAGTPNNGQTNVVLQRYDMAVTTANATLTGLTVTTAGTYAAADLTNLKCWYQSSSTFNSGTATLLSTNSSVTTAGSQVFPSFTSQSITSGNTGYIFVTADIASGATNGNTINIASNAFSNISFSSGTKTGTDPVAAGGLQTITIAVPDIALSSPAASSANITVGTSNNVVYRFDLAITTATPSLTGVTISTSTGSNVSGDLTNLKCWYQTASTFNAGTATLLSTKTTSLASGMQVFPSFSSQSLITGSTYYIFITADVPLTATPNNTIIVSAITTSDLTFATGNKTGTANASGTKTIIDCTPVDVTSAAASSASSSSVLTWVNPACYDEILIVAALASNNGNPTGDGSAYTGNLAYGSGSVLGNGFVVYKGSTSSQTVTGLTNGTQYFYKYFTRRGITWSSGTEVDATPNVAGYYWNGASIAANPAAGGTGTWGTTNAWRQPSATGAQATWVDNNNAIFAGTAGTVTLDATRIATGFYFNTSGYVLANSTTQTLTGPIVLGNNVGLTFSPNVNIGTPASGTLNIRSVSGSGTANITINSAQNPSAVAQRINIATASSSITVPINIVSAGSTGTAAVAGIVGTAVGTSLSSAAIITNNTAIKTVIGATSGYDLTANGVISGSADLMFAAGASGGAGTVTLGAENTYTGATIFNAANSGVIRLGITNALPTSTNVTMANSSSNGGIFDLNGFNQTIGSLTTGVGGGSIINNGATDATLTISGSTSPAAFGLVIADGTTNKTLLTRAGTGTLTLSGANTYSGATTVSAGTLQLAGGNVGSVGSITSSPIGKSTLNLNGGTLSSNSTTARTVLNATSIGGNIILGDATNTGALTFSAATTISGATRTLTTESAVTFAGAIGDGGNAYGVTKAGAGTLTLSGANSYTGATTLSAGTLQLAGGNVGSVGSITSSPIGRSTLNLNGGTLSSNSTIARTVLNATSLGGDITLGDATNTGALTFSAATSISGATRTLTTASAVTFAGTIGDGGNAYGITKAGAGTLTLSGANTYTGTTTISAGAINITGITGITSTSFTASAQSVTFSSTTPTNGTYQIFNGPVSVTTQSFSSNAGAGKSVTFNYSTGVAVVADVATITSFSPTSGGAGTSIVITGTYLTGTSSVSFNGVSASSFTVDSDSQITAIVPAGLGAGGLVSIVKNSLTVNSATNFVVNYYLASGGSITNFADFGQDASGTDGNTPTAINSNNYSNFYIVNNTSVTQGANITLGTGSKIIVGDGTNATALIIPATRTSSGTIDVNDGGTLTANNTSILHTLGTLGSSSSTVVYNASGTQAVATKNYANLTISGGNAKTLAGSAMVSGTLTINGTVLALGSNNLSPANLTIDGSGTRNGTWGSTASTATYKNDTYFSGSGVATVTNNTALSPSISGVTASQSITYGDPSITLTGTVSATGPVYPANGETISVTINGNTQTTTTTGGNGSFSITYACNTIPYSATPYTITYAYAGNGFWNPANNATSTLTINKAAQSITFASTNSILSSAADYNPGATSATSGINAITYSSSNPAVATIVSGNIHVTGVGQTTITASQASSTNYNAASATQTLTVNLATSISTQPSGYTILATNANPTALTVTAIGTNLSYQWYSNTANSTSNGTSINSATSAAYTPPTTLGAMYYYVVVHGDYGSDVTSNVVAVVISDNFTWNGSASTDWNTAANWTPAGVPIATAIVSVPNCTNDPVIGNLNISSAGSVTLTSGTMLTLSGIITNNGTFTIENGATLVQTGTGSNANSGNGTYNVKQAITGSGGSTPNDRFWYLGGALLDASSTALLSSAGNQLWQWNESSFNYALVPTGQQLAQGKSYVLRSGQNETINFSGASLSNGTVTVPGLTRTGTTQTYRGCHLISNPYPSYLDWNAITKTNIGTTMYIRTAIGTTLDVMETFNTVNNLATTISSVPLTQYIAPMQGFWVKVTTDNQTGSLTMDNSMRSHQPTGSGLRSTAQDFPAFLRFNMIDGQNKDQVILLMSPDASMSLDNFDSEKMSASGYAQFYSTVNATKLVINGMKNVKAKTSVPLTLVMPTSKSYTFQAEEFNIEDGLILLEDKQEGVIQDLTINPTYSFFGNAGTNATRFVVHFQLASAPVLVGGPQELESLGSDELMSDNIQIVSNNQGTVIVRLDEGFKPEGGIRIFDASGRLVEQTDFNDQETTIHLNEQAGMYFVEVSAGKLMVKKKIVIE